MLFFYFLDSKGERLMWQPAPADGHSNCCYVINQIITLRSTVTYSLTLNYYTRHETIFGAPRDDMCYKTRNPQRIHYIYNIFTVFFIINFIEYFLEKRRISHRRIKRKPWFPLFIIISQTLYNSGCYHCRLDRIHRR